MEQNYLKDNQDKLKKYAAERLMSLQLVEPNNLCAVQRGLAGLTKIEVDAGKWGRIIEFQKKGAWLNMLSEIAGKSFDSFPSEKTTDGIIQGLWEFPIKVTITMGDPGQLHLAYIECFVLKCANPKDDADKMASNSYDPFPNDGNHDHHFTHAETKTMLIKPFCEKLIISALTTYNFSGELFPQEAEASKRGDVEAFEKRILEWLATH